MSNANKHNTGNKLKNTGETESASPNQKLEADLGPAEAISYLEENYVNQNEDPDPVLVENLEKARNGEPAALESLASFVSQEQEKVMGGGSELDEQAKLTLDKLGQARIALEVHRERVEKNATDVAEKSRLEAVHEQRRTENETEARKDAHEAIDKQPPKRDDFNRESTELAKKFGTNASEVLKGNSYDGMIDSPKVLKALYNLITDTAKNPESTQDAYTKFAQKRDRLLGGLTNSGANNTAVSNGNEVSASAKEAA